METTYAFDVYGTLIDTHGVVEALKPFAGNQAHAFSTVWREKQLEYAFRRGLMKHYVPFSTCTAHALDYTANRFEIDLTEKNRAELLDVYKRLPAFPDARPALETLKAQGHRLFAFSNGSEAAVDRLLESAGLRALFEGIVSVEAIRSFKPDPGVYAHFMRCAEAKASEAWLISSNPFDVIGAISAGMRSAWVKRSENALFDPWGISPTRTVSRLTEL